MYTRAEESFSKDDTEIKGPYSDASRVISVLSVHDLPKKGYETRREALKAYLTVLGGVLYMSVSSSPQAHVNGGDFEF